MKMRLLILVASLVVYYGAFADDASTQVVVPPVEETTPAQPIKIDVDNVVPDVKVNGDVSVPVDESTLPLDENKAAPAVVTPMPEKTVPAVETSVVGEEGLLKGKDMDYCLKFDKTKWEVVDNKINPSAEFLLKGKGQELYALIIPEKTPVMLEHMPEVIKFNAQKAGMKDAEIYSQEMKNIGGQNVLFVEWGGTFEPINAKVFYKGIIYTGDKGTIQVYTYALDNQKDEFAEQMMNFLNGFCLINVAEEKSVI